MKTVIGRAAAASMMGAASCGALAGPDWIEDADAGSVLGSAQLPAGLGPIQTIAGNLGGRGEIADFEDMYIIGVDDPGTFRLSIAASNFDAQLFVFNITLAGGALGLLANDDESGKTSDPVLTSMATDGTSAVLDLPGDYLIAISGSGRNPVSALGPIFDLADPTEVSGADGPGGLLRHIGWEGEGVTGSYTIEMDGTVFPRIPAPGVGVVLGAGLVIGGRRRAENRR